ncbi:uncharacterized protein [Apostichopus japonicus]|uniref:uncharacterized protein n=1 Tax=Stichopus japonicus TaxID=307972 RepID=UPI003AB19AAA
MIFYTAIYESCSGKGTNNDQCACVITGGDDHCAVTGNNGFTPITLPTDNTGLSYTCDTGIVRIQLDYTSTASSAILSTNSYFMDTLSPPQECRWDITGPEDSQLAIIFRGFNLLRSEDRFSLKYGDGRGAEEFLRYSSDVTDIPVTRAGQTISILDTPITFDSNLVKINYKSGDSTVFTTNKGALFEVRLLGVGTCSSPCLNGGQCQASCSCTSGYQGEFCEQTIPPDYTCVVKNFYTEPNSPYTTSVYAIAGKNIFNANEFDFEIDPKLKSDSKIVSHSYGKELILPGSSCSRYNKQDTCRFSGLVSCLFYSNDFVVPETIPSFVATKSKLISPVGRFTNTVSVGEDATFSVYLMEDVSHSIKWKLNGKPQHRWDGKATVTIKNVVRDDAGIYEAFLPGRKSAENIDIVRYRLIVRECSDGMYGPPSCMSACPICKNGGSCHDIYGTCVCPPAYGGETCEELLNQDTIGRNSSLTCPGVAIAYAGCKNILFCLPDPAGCMCMPGWNGAACDKQCEPLKFGLDCQFDCHCNGGAQCDVATGACPNGCDGSFTGPNCQD